MSLCCFASKNWGVKLHIDAAVSPSHKNKIPRLDMSICNAILTCLPLLCRPRSRFTLFCVQLEWTGGTTFQHASSYDLAKICRKISTFATYKMPFMNFARSNMCLRKGCWRKRMWTSIIGWTSGQIVLAYHCFFENVARLIVFCLCLRTNKKVCHSTYRISRSPAATFSAEFVCARNDEQGNAFPSGSDTIPNRKATMQRQLHKRRGQ